MGGKKVHIIDLPPSVENGNEILDDGTIHPDGGGLDRQIVDRGEHAEGEQEDADGDKYEVRLAERLRELRAGGAVGVRRVAGGDGDVGDDEQEQYDEGAGAHGPGEADLADEARRGDGEDDAPDAGPRGGDAEGGAALLAEPPVQRVERALEDGRGADGAADPLRQQELVVLRREGRHHQPEDVQERATED